jgi:hypothetical protein
MAESSRKRSLALDVVIAALADVLVILSSKMGLRAGQPATVGPGAVLGGVYLGYLGLLFLLSYLFPEACNVFSFMQYVSEGCSRPRRRHLALCYCGFLLVAGADLLLVGFGVF